VQRAVGVALKTRKARRDSERHLVNHITALPSKMLSSQSNSLINVAANPAPHHDVLVNKPTPSSTKKRRFAPFAQPIGSHAPSTPSDKENAGVAPFAPLKKVRTAELANSAPSPNTPVSKELKMTLVTPQTSFSLASGNPVSTAGATVDFDHSESEPGDKHLVHAQTMLNDALPAPPFTPKELPKGAGTPDTPLGGPTFTSKIDRGRAKQGSASRNFMI
jgi:hypothetical protein